MKVILILSALLGSHAFVPTSVSRRGLPTLQYEDGEKASSSGSTGMPSFDFDFGSLTKGITSKLEDLDIQAIQENTFSGEMGSRGEIYVGAQFALLACVAIGGIPYVGPIVSVLGGPILLLTGLAFAALGVVELGSDLSPWPKPVEGSTLKTDGVFGEMRHPIYGGLLAACVGFSILTDSASRLLLTAILWYVLEKKADYEEEQLAEKLPGYGSYKKSVPTKFFPKTIIDNLPF